MSYAVGLVRAGLRALAGTEVDGEGRRSGFAEVRIHIAYHYVAIGRDTKLLAVESTQTKVRVPRWQRMLR